MRSFTVACLLIGTSAAFAQETGDPRLGLEVATEACASCHAVLRVEDRSPNPNAPPFADIANVRGMTAIALGERVEVRMPVLELTHGLSVDHGGPPKAAQGFSDARE